MPHPEFIMIGKNVVAVMASNEVVHIIDALHITAVEDLPAKKRR